MTEEKRVKFKHVKSQAFGFVLKDPKGNLVPRSFAVSIRSPKGRFNQNQPWRNLFDKAPTLSNLTSKERSPFIKLLVERGWRVVAVTVSEIPIAEELNGTT